MHLPVVKEHRRVPLQTLGVSGRSMALVLALLCAGSAALAQTTTRQWASEYELKAAFIYNVIPFIDWPERAVGDHFIIGFAGEGSMTAALANFFKDKRIGSKPIEVRNVHTLAELRGCNVLLLAYPDSSRMREALSQLRGTNVLTIGDGESFARSGGVVAFVPQENTFRLAVNERAAERAHLKISSKLLSMTKLVPDEAGGK